MGNKLAKVLRATAAFGGVEMNDKENIALISMFFLLVYILEIISCSRIQIL